MSGRRRGWGYVTAALAVALSQLVPPGHALAAGEPASAAAQGVAQERTALAEHRRLLLKILADEEAACRERFAVTACQDDVRRRRREALAPLRERELRLEESERRARAEERRRAVAAKLSEAGVGPAGSGAASASAAGPRPSLAQPLGPAASGPSAGAPPHAAASRPAPVLRVRRAAAPASAASARETEASERVREAERRRDQGESVRARIDKREAERRAAGRRSDPLPLPGVASQPAR